MPNLDATVTPLVSGPERRVEPPATNEHYRRLGTAALNGSSVELVLPDHAELPAGFYYAEADTIELDEVASLFQSVPIGRRTSTESLKRQFKGFEEDGLKSVEVGVRGRDSHQLVGYGGLIVDMNGEGELGDFVVNPAYQGKGIGRAIIDQRIAQAGSLGVHKLYIPPLEPTNTLRTYYAKRGFKEHRDGMLVKRIKR